MKVVRAAYATGTSAGDAQVKARAAVAVQDDYDKALVQCDEAMLQARHGYKTSRVVKISLAGAGLLAGSIIVPTLAAAHASLAIIGAFGGISGAMNAAQLGVDEIAASPADESLVYNNLRTSIALSMGKYAATSDPQQQYMAVTELVAMCRYRPMPIVTKSIDPPVPLGSDPAPAPPAPSAPAVGAKT
jgi:ActR/RegA family two-component response regulator